MWLLKFHLAVSILCLITFIGFRWVFKDLLKENGYIRDENGKRGNVLIFFIPILNVASVLILFVLLTMTKEELSEWCEKHKKTKKENEEK